MTLSARWQQTKRYCADLVNSPSIQDRNVLLVGDGENWVFHWIIFYIEHYLKANHEISIMSGCKANQFARSKVIHFVDRYAYLNQYADLVHSSNHLFLNWFHGDPEDPRLHVRALFTRLKAIINRLEKVIVSCSISQRSLLESGIPESKLIEIPLGVNLQKFRPMPQVRMSLRQQLGIDEQAICIGSFQKDGVGWGEGVEPKLEKGPDILLQVLAGLFQHYPRLHVLLTGPSRGYVKQGLDKLGIPYTHHYLDNYLDVSKYYQALDLYLITARCEGGPAALLESWATGVPIVSTQVGMPADLIQPGINGLLAPVEDVDDIIKQAIALLDHPEFCNRCRHQALLDVRNYDWPIIAEKYYQLYRPYLPLN